MAKKRTAAKTRESSGGKATKASTSGSAERPEQAAASESLTTQRTRPDRCLVVGVGASAGGLAAFKRLLAGFPHAPGLAIVLVQHLAPNHESLMAGLLAKGSKMPVIQVEETTPIEPNHVYVIPPNKYIRIEDRQLVLDDPKTTHGMRLAIDYFFRSLAECRARTAVGIVLSGTGSDGTQGVREIKAAGGLALVQDPTSSEYAGMPRSAVESGMVDFVLPIEDMPELLMKYAAHPYTLSDSDRDRLYEPSPDHFRAILDLLKSHTNYDFSCYKKGTLNRRIQRRMSVRHVSTLQEYLELLRDDSQEALSLFKDLLIGVTRFFREEPAWQLLEQKVVAEIVAAKADDAPVRIWVPGCATGEEAYSLAMVFYDQFEKQNKPLDLQLFGTDLDDHSISVARSGTYPESIATDVSAARLHRYFTEQGDRYRVNKQLRESTVFAVQNLISDPPFSNLDLISCRNVLIYLESKIQKKLIQMFHFALREKGHLFLGTSESVSDGSDLFETVSKDWRIFRKVGSGRSIGAFPVVRGSGTQHSTLDDRATRRSPQRSQGTVEIARKLLLDKFAPPSVLIDRQEKVHYFHGELQPYLSLPPGEPTHDLLAMLAKHLRSKLRGLIRRALHDQSTATAVVPKLSSADHSSLLRLTVEPASFDDGKSYLLISFADEPAETAPELDTAHTGRLDPPRSGSEAQQLLRQLEFELIATREDLQSTIEELESSNEELKSSNEEVVSMNEELQSTNEELETSREELQSLNEELSTVNNQLEDKVDELESSNNDLSNLLSSTDIATIFLDTEFRIRLFTPSCTDLLHILNNDIGRPIQDLTRRVNDEHLLTDARSVLEKLVPIERETHHENGLTFIRRILPYRTSDQQIAGVVITFTDITSLHSAHRQLGVREQQQAAAARLGRLALSTADLQVLLDEAVREVADTLSVEMAKVLELQQFGEGDLLLRSGLGWQDGLVGSATVGSGMDSQAGYTLRSNSPVIVRDLRTEKRFRGPTLLSDHGVVSGMSVIIGSEDEPWGVFGAHTASRREFTPDDINFLQTIAHILAEAIQRFDSEQQIRDRESRLRLVTDALPVLLAYCDRDRIYQFCNARYEEWFGLTQDQILGKPVQEVIGEEAYARVAASIDRVLAGERLTHEQLLPYRHGPERHVRIDYIPHRNAAGKVTGWYAMIEDFSERVRAEHSRARLASIVEHSNDAIIGQNLDGTITNWNAAAERMYGYSPQEIVGQSLKLLAPADRQHEVAEILQRVEQGEAVQHFETFRKRKDGSQIEVSLTVSPICDAQGQVIGASAIARDITQRKLAERELKEWADRLEERVAERTAVAEKRAIDLRELATQITYAEQRARKRLAQAIHDDLQQILVATKMRLPAGGEMASGDELVRVSELLDEALLKSRSLVSELSPPILQDGSLADAFSWLARHMHDHHGLHVELEHRGDDHPLDENVKTVIFEAVRELLFNVVKHAETQEASLLVRQEAALVRAIVSDGGKGFEAEAVEQQCDGFGLFSIRERVSAFGGEMLIDSAPGQGARLCISLPLATHRPTTSRPAPVIDTPQAEPTQSPGSTDAVRILIADDHKIVREGLVRILDVESDMQVVGEAADGQEAVEKAISLQPDVVIMDITMPRLNGIEATREIAQRLPFVSVIGLSLHDQQDLGAAIQHAGAVAYLQKDSASTGLIQAIRQHCQRRNRDETTST